MYRGLRGSHPFINVNFNSHPGDDFMKKVKVEKIKKTDFKISGTYEPLLKSMPSFIQEYVGSLGNRRRPNTVYSYMLDYRILLEWMIKTCLSSASDIKNVTIEELNALTFFDLETFFSYLVNGYKSHRHVLSEDTNTDYQIAKSETNGRGLKRKVASLSSLYFYLYKQRELLSRDEMSKFKGYFKPKDENTNSNITKFLRPDDVDRLLKAVSDLSIFKEPYLTKAKRNLLRDETIVKSFLGIGMRVSTLCAMDTRDIDFINCEANLLMKGKMKETLPVDPIVLEFIKEYLNSPDRYKPVDNDAKKAVFLSNNGARISVTTVQKMMKKYMLKAGLNSDLSVHSLRHTFGTAIYNETGDAKLTGELLGHHDGGTTASRFYAFTDRNRMRKAVNGVALGLKRK